MPGHPKCCPKPPCRLNPDFTITTISTTATTCTIRLVDTSTSGNNSQIIDWDWTVDGGFDSTGHTVVIVLPRNNGQRQIRLVIEDENGCIAEVTKPYLCTTDCCLGPYPTQAQVTLNDMVSVNCIPCPGVGGGTFILNGGGSGPNGSWGVIFSESCGGFLFTGRVDLTLQCQSPGARIITITQEMIGIFGTRFVRTRSVGYSQVVPCSDLTGSMTLTNSSSDVSCNFGLSTAEFEFL